MRAEQRGRRVDQLRDLDRVLEQAAAVGVVVVLGGGRLAVRAAARRGRAEQPGDQQGQVRVLDGGDQAVEVLAQLGDRAGGPVEQVLPRHGVDRRAAERLDRQLPAVARVLGELAAHMDDVAGLERRRVRRRPTGWRGRVPERSASTSRRYGASSRLRRRSVSRTSRTRSTGQASVRSRTSDG